MKEIITGIQKHLQDDFIASGLQQTKFHQVLLKNKSVRKSFMISYKEMKPYEHRIFMEKLSQLLKLMFEIRFSHRRSAEATLFKRFSISSKSIAWFSAIAWWACMLSACIKASSCVKFFIGLRMRGLEPRNLGFYATETLSCDRYTRESQSELHRSQYENRYENRYENFLLIKLWSQFDGT